MRLTPHTRTHTRAHTRPPEQIREIFFFAFDWIKLSTQLIFSSMAIFVLLLLLPLYSFRAHRTNKTIRAHNHIITVRGGRSDTGVEMGVIPHPVPLLASTFAAYHPPKSEQSSQPDKITDCITRGGTHFYTYYSWRTHSTLQKEERRQREICSVLAFFFLLHFFT